MKTILTFLTGFFLMIGSAISGKPFVKQKTLIPSVTPAITSPISPTITNQQPTNTIITITIPPQQIEQVEDIPEIEEISTLETDIDDLPDFDIELSLE